MATPKSGPTAPKILDTETIEKLAGIGCTLAEMASVMKCSVDTLANNFSEHIRIGRENGKASVRRMMWRHAEQGNSTALKYLVTNVLHEKIEDTERKSAEESTAALIMDKLSGISTEAILRIVRDNEPKAV